LAVTEDGVAPHFPAISIMAVERTAPKDITRQDT